MLKVMRVLRIMRGLREVRLLLNSLMGSVKPLIWTIVMIATINFMFGICFVQAAAGHRQDRWKDPSNLQRDGSIVESMETEEEKVLYQHWASVQEAMYTLFKVSTGGQSWGEVADPMLLVGGQNFAIFLLYMVL